MLLYDQEGGAVYWRSAITHKCLRFVLCTRGFWGSLLPVPQTNGSLTCVVQNCTPANVPLCNATLLPLH